MNVEGVECFLDESASTMDPADASSRVTPDEEAIRTEARRFRVVAIVAGVLFALQVLPQLAVPLVTVPTFAKMFTDMGGTVPQPTALLIALGPWTAVIMLAIDALIFWGFYRLAKRYWIGLLFAPLFAVTVLAGAVVWMLYMPMFQVITLIK